MQPIIGMFAEVDGEKYTRINYQYTRVIEACGGIPFLIPYTDNAETLKGLIERCDGFLFTGGADVNPERYGEEKKPTCGDIQYYRDELEFTAFRLIKDTPKPILGICRGMQFLNVALGGTLYQDLPTENPTEVPHRQREAKYSLLHNVQVVADTPLYAVAQTPKMLANSFHHQAVKTLGKGLEIMALADDGIIEAVYAPDKKFLRAYQWHPERLVDADEQNRLLFVEFITACQKA